ncbi:serine protease, partial [Streptomyces zinciresistens]
MVRIHDAAGLLRGVGFVADHRGTVVTCHEAVAGRPGLVLRPGDGRGRTVCATSVTELPGLGLALVRAEGLGAAPLPVSAREGVATGAYVRIAADGWREARVLGPSCGPGPAPVGSRALELAIGTAGRDALRSGGARAAGGPVLDAETGAVVAVLGAPRPAHDDAVRAVPLRPAPDGPLTELLTENAATVPAYGADLNLAGVLELTATSVGQDGPAGSPARCRDGARTGRAADIAPVERAVIARELLAFGTSGAVVLGLVGVPGSGRTTELAALAARRLHGRAPAPTLWLRGADLRQGDGSIADAARRAVGRAARIVAASTGRGPLGDLAPERLARHSLAAGRPLLLLLDGPEEMPPALAHRLPEWTEGTAEWLRATGTRLVVACRPEFWERAGAEFPPELLYGSARQEPARRFPRCVPLDGLSRAEAARARARYGIPDGVLRDADARHPLTLRLLSERGRPGQAGAAGG